MDSLDAAVLICLAVALFCFGAVHFLRPPPLRDLPTKLAEPIILRMQSGDVLVLKCESSLSKEQYDRLVTTLGAWLGGRRIVVLERNMCLHGLVHIADQGGNSDAGGDNPLPVVEPKGAKDMSRL